jgi:hypothetical protein
MTFRSARGDTYGMLIHVYIGGGLFSGSSIYWTGSGLSCGTRITIRSHPVSCALIKNVGQFFRINYDIWEAGNPGWDNTSLQIKPMSSAKKVLEGAM